MSDKIKNNTEIENISNLLSSDAREALHILSVPSLLYDPMADILLIKTKNANGTSRQLVEELRSYPIWHNRTSNSWVFDSDVREYAFEKLNGSKKSLRRKVLQVMVEHRNEFENVPLWDADDYDLQIARLSSSLEECRADGIHKFRQIFDTAYKFNQSETERVVDLYLEESFDEYSSSEPILPDDMSSVYFMRGLHAYKNKNFSKATRFLLPVWKKMSESYESMKNAADSSHLMGVMWGKKRRHWGDAEEAFKQSLEISKILNDRHRQDIVYHSLGNLLSKKRSRWGDAEEAFKQSLILLNKNDFSGQGMVYHSLGNLLSQDWSRWGEAEETLEESLGSFRKINERDGQGRVYHSLGNLLSKKRSRWKDAEEAYRQSLRLLNKNDLIGQGEVYYHLGNSLSQNRSRLIDAEKEYKQSLDLFIETNNQKSQAKVYHKLGDLYSQKRLRWNDAEDAYQQSLELLENLNDERDQADVYHSIGNMLSRESSRWGDAEDAYQQSLRLSSITGQKNSIRMASKDYSKLLIKRKDYKNAIIRIQKVLEYETDENNRNKLLKSLEYVESKLKTE